jgi:hypothetical protein
MKTSRVRQLTIATTFICAIAPLRAEAEPASADRSLATQLFREGRTLLEQGHIPQACRKLEESQRLDPGGGTLLNLALCHEKEGRTATAWTEFTEGLGLAKKDERPMRIEFAKTHIALLEPLLSRLFIQVPASADLPDLEIKRDGTVLGRAAWSVGMAVDPGDHLIEVAAPGKLPWRQSVTVGPKGDNKTVAIPPLDAAPAAAPPPPTLAASPAVAPATSPTDAPPPPPDTVQTVRTGPSAIAWVALGVGVAATGVGTYFGVRAISLKRDADAACPGNVCTADGASKNDDAIRSSNLATIGFGVGILGVGAGIILLATTSGGSRPAPAAESVHHPSGIAALGVDAVSVDPTASRVVVSGHF